MNRRMAAPQFLVVSSPRPAYKMKEHLSAEAHHCMCVVWLIRRGRTPSVTNRESPDRFDASPGVRLTWCLCVDMQQQSRVLLAIFLLPQIVCRKSAPFCF